MSSINATLPNWQSASSKHTAESLPSRRAMPTARLQATQVTPMPPLAP